MNFNDDITIIPVQPSDYKYIIELLHELSKHENTISQLNIVQLKKAMQADNPKLEALVAKHCDDVIGCVLFYRGFDVLSASYGFHISDIIVAQNMRGNGVGSKLISYLSEHGLKQGLQWLSWTVDAHNEKAKNFYLSLGATVINVNFMAMGASAMKILLAKS
jgi:GNAT superfamily N-acetyltransferase